MPQTPSTRWCPTPEQLMILEEMYRTGVRTPNASQIQQITAHLSFYGKIEGKNVFYWFQNHKARDRQKLRRRLSRQHQLLHGFNDTHPLPPPPPPPPLHFHNLQQEFATPPLSPTSQFYHQSPPVHFLQQQQGSPQEEATTQGMNLLCKLETSEGSTSSSGGTAWGSDWMVVMESCSPGVHVPVPPCCSRPLRTLELFPTTSTGIKDDCTTSKSSSCSTSTN